MNAPDFALTQASHTPRAQGEGGCLPSQPPLSIPRQGDLCPQCQAERLDYDGLLNLACPKCGYIAGSGGYT